MKKGSQISLFGATEKEAVSNLIVPNSFILLTKQADSNDQANLIKPVGNKLFDILYEECGYISVDLKFIPALKDSIMPISTRVMLCLGKVAEAMIVRCCKNDVMTNRKWARFARRGKNRIPSYDRYEAIGRGLRTTQQHILYYSAYNPSDPQRDISWVHKDDPKKELLAIGGSVQGAQPCGLQIKVSTDGIGYVAQDISKARYQVPIVYFDLQEDFDSLVSHLHNNGLQVSDSVLLRGKDVDPEIHNGLLFIKPLLEGLYSRQISPIDLLSGNADLQMAVTIQDREEQQINTILLAH